MRHFILFIYNLDLDLDLIIIKILGKNILKSCERVQGKLVFLRGGGNIAKYICSIMCYA